MMKGHDRFLDQVAAELPLPDDVRQGVVEELAAHLADSTAELVHAGRAPDAAEAEAIARLGPPTDLARALAEARRGRSLLLAAAGAGTWAAVRTGVRGALVGGLFIVLAALLVMLVVRAAAGVLVVQVSPNWSGGWNTVLTAATLCLGAFLAGTEATRAVAASSWRTLREVRAGVIGVGGLVIGWLALVLFESALNWASVIALLLVPVSFGIGARIGRAPKLTVRSAGAMSLAALLLVGGVTAGTAASSGASNYEWTLEDHGYEMIAPWWQDPAAGPTMDFPSSSSFSSVPGIQTVTVNAESPTLVSRFHGFRLEAWRAEPPGNGWRLVPGQDAPFATAPAEADGLSISGTIRFDHTPGVNWAELVLTGIAPDGQRYLLTASGPEPTAFHGSVWSWFFAPR